MLPERQFFVGPGRSPVTGEDAGRRRAIENLADLLDRDRAQARHGFTESWRERLERVGFDQINLAALSINYRTPEEVMAEAEPVIRAVLPDANVPTSIRSTGVPVRHGSVEALGEIIGTWLAEHAEGEGIACVIGDPAFVANAASADGPRPVADSGTGKGARVRPSRALIANTCLNML